MDDNEIDEQFKTLDDAIINTPENVSNLFVQVKSSIDDLEAENEEKYNIYRYQLHLKKASYFQAVGNLEQWQKEEKLMKKYFAICHQQINDQESKVTDQTSIGRIVCNIQTNTLIQTDIQNYLNNLKALFDNEQHPFYKELESTVMQFTKSPVTSLNEYIELDTVHSSIHMILNILQIQTLTHSEAVEGQNKNSLLSLLTNLNFYLSVLQYQRKVDFVEFVLSHRPELRSILFDNIPLTEERIELHTKKLFVLFHPDKCGLKKKAIFTEIFELIAEDSSKQLEELTNRIKRSDVVDYYKARGKEYWDIALEYKCARKQEWDKVKQLKREILMNLSDRELENHQHYYAMSSYEQNRAAARELEIAEASKRLIAEKIELKKYMANSLYLVGVSRMLEAQICIIAGIHLAVTSDNSLRWKNDLEALEHLLQKIRHGNTLLFAASADADENQEDKSALSKAWMAFRQDSITLRQIKRDISPELRKSIPHSCLLLDREGMGTIRDCTGPISAFVSLGIGDSCIISDILLRRRCYEKSPCYTQRPKICEVLNKIIKDALNHYNKGKYSEFLYSLSTFYDRSKLLVGIKEVRDSNRCKISLDIRPTVIVKELLKHDFLPEAIAYFLILLGEVLLFGPHLKPKDELSASIRLELPKYSEFHYFATKVFEEVWTNGPLAERANEIDKKFNSSISITKTSCIEGFAGVTLNDTNSIPNDYIKERLIIPVSVRLEELKTIAKINNAIAQIINRSPAEFEQRIDTINSVNEELMKELDKENMFALTEIGRQALSDILATFAHPKDRSSNRNEIVFRRQNFSKLENEVFIKNINKVLTGDQTVSHCEPVILFDDDEVDEFVLVDKALGRILKINKNKFVDSVRRNYCENTEPLKSWIEDIIRKENLHDIDEWETSFLERKHSLTFQYLPFLSIMCNLIFIPCTVKPHRDHTYVFSPTKKVIDLSRSPRSAKTTIYVVIDHNDDPSYTRLIKGIFVTCKVSLNYIYNQLNSVNDRKRKVDLLNQIALHYQQQAEKLDKTHHLEALQNWSCAQKFYLDSLKLNRNHLTAMLGYAKCLIMLGKYKVANAFLVERADKKTYFFRDSAERWLLLGVVRRKLLEYTNAADAVQEALKLRKNYIEAENELNLISRLKQETIAERIQYCKKMNLLHAELNREQYNILSIDGGGIRGLVPAIWISELERRTQLNSCSMFHMMAGTSTGAIITAGLSLSNKNNTTLPRYRAVDIVELYTTHSDKVFSRRDSMWSSLLMASKYTAGGRKTLFNQYFGNARLSHALTELVITTVHSGSNMTNLFKRSESRVDHSKNHKIVDVLMCTTAAPTYFPPYQLDNNIFVDGGVQANNPAMIAYAEACRNDINRDNIFILSLGTCDYVPDPSHPNTHRNLLFWLKNNDNVLKVIFDGPQNNIDSHLSNILGGEKYHRWQIWLEEPIVLDDIRKETLNNLTELARAHFEEMDSFDSGDRLGKLIERLKGPEH